MASHRVALLVLMIALVMWTPAAARAQVEKGGDAARVEKGDAAQAEKGGDAARVEKGRLVVAQVCTTCHTTLGRMLQVHKQTPEQWKDLVFFMISRGAQVMPDEVDAVTAFLVATAGRERPTAARPAPDSKTR